MASTLGSTPAAQTPPCARAPYKSPGEGRRQRRGLTASQHGSADRAGQVTQLGRKELRRPIRHVQAGMHGLSDPVHEGLAELVPQSAAENNRLQVEQVLRVGERDAKRPDRLVDQLDYNAVLLGERGRDHAARGAISTLLLHDLEELGAPALRLPSTRRVLDRSATGVGLQVTEHAAAALASSVLDQCVANLTRRAKSLPQLTVQHQAATNPGAHEHAQEVLEGPTRALPPLAEHRHAHVIIEVHVHTAQTLGELVAHGNRADLESGDVGRTGHCRALDDTRGADANGLQPGERLTSGLKRALDRLGHRRQDRLRAGLWRRYPTLAYDLTLSQDHGLDLGLAQVDPRNQLCHLRPALLSPFGVGSRNPMTTQVLPLESSGFLPVRAKGGRPSEARALPGSAS